MTCPKCKENTSPLANGDWWCPKCKEDVPSTEKLYPLPTPDAVVMARSWLFAGAPAASRDHNAKEAVATINKLIEALPHYIKMYAFGSPEWRKVNGYDPSVSS